MKYKIWIFSHYAHEPPAGGLRYHNWGKELVQKGCYVTIFSASSQHSSIGNKINSENSNELYKSSESDGVKYVYLKTRDYDKNNIRRILGMLDYFWGLFRITKRFEKPDLIISTSPHLLTPLAGIWISKRLNVPSIVDIVDLWPSSIIHYGGFSKHNPLIRLLFCLEKYIYIKANTLIFSFEGGSQYILDQRWSSQVDLGKVFHINMGLDLPIFDENAKHYELDYSEIKNDRKFKIVYTGAVRRANALKTICDTAELVKNKGYDDIFFMIFGAGTEIDSLKKYCESRNIDNIYFHGYIEKHQIPYVLLKSDLCLFSFLDTPLKKYGGSQQKSFEYFASGKPILSNWKSDYNLIERYNCGYVTKTQSPEDILEGILTLYNMSKTDREKLGENARKLAERYTQPIIAREVMNAIEYTLRNKKNE